MDYRRVDEQLFCHDVEKSKKELLRKLGGRVKNHYEHIKNRNSNLNTEFLKIYGFCCVYCGLNSRLFNSRTGLEVDHFICESSFKIVKDGKEIIDHIKAGNINNALEYIEGDLYAVLDADMTPKKEFLLKTVRYFSN